MARNTKKMWQARCARLYLGQERWHKFAGYYHSRLTDADTAVREYEREMGALLDETEEERDVALAECTRLHDTLVAYQTFLAE